MSRSFDAIIVGAGQAGPPLAGRLTSAGMKVALIERKLFGGTCVNTGCTPTKTLIASAHAAHLTRRAGDYGVDIEGAIRVDMKRVKARTDALVADSRSGVENWVRGMEGCTVIQGHARFVGPDSIAVNGETLKAPRIFLNVGGRANIPDMPGVKDVPFLTNSSLLAIEHVPEHLVVIGGSYIGLEFAQAFRRLGAEVTVVEKSPRLIAREDIDVSDTVREILEAEGIAVRSDSECIHFSQRGKSVVAGLSCEDDSKEVVGSHLLLAVGRRPNTDDLDLDKAGVETDARGYISVDDRLATNVPGIWAMGDCNGKGAFTHTAYNDFEIIAANLLDGADRRVSARVQGYALYIDPPLGRAGMSEAEAKKAGHDVLVGKRPMTRVSRAKEKGETQGFMKVVADAKTKKILGAAILGVGGDEAVHGIIDLMSAGQTYPTLQWAVPIHPTVSELIPTIIGEMKSAE